MIVSRMVLNSSPQIRDILSAAPESFQPMFRTLFVFTEFVCVTKPHKARPSEVIGIAVIWPP